MLVTNFGTVAAAVFLVLFYFFVKIIWRMLDIFIATYVREHIEEKRAMREQARMEYERTGKGAKVIGFQSEATRCYVEKEES